MCLRHNTAVPQLPGLAKSGRACQLQDGVISATFLAFAGHDRHQRAQSRGREASMQRLS